MIQLAIAGTASVLSFCSMVEALIELREVRKRDLNGLRRLVARGLADADSARFVAAGLFAADAAAGVVWLLMAVTPENYDFNPGIFFAIAIAMVIAWAAGRSRYWRLRTDSYHADREAKSEEGHECD
jgi:hypothetical protein